MVRLRLWGGFRSVGFFNMLLYQPDRSGKKIPHTTSCNMAQEVAE